ncbi:MAG: hypothetical protein IBJ11_11315 [Phycisphaerales bacterium]|nr:hypothetical protein [Phycisphaerales bacterium]
MPETNEAGAQPPRAISRRRLAPGGPRRIGPFAAVTAFALVFLAAAAALWLFHALRPIPAPGVVQGPPVPAAPRAAGAGSAATGIEARQQHLAGLSKDNIFAPDRAFWTAPGTPAATGPAGPGGARVQHAATPPAPPPTPDDPSRLPDDVRQALAALQLTGIYLSRPERRAEQPDAPAQPALVAFIAHGNPIQQGGVQRPRVHAYREGQDFTDERFPQAAWRIRAIDGKANRVLLERSGSTAALTMFKTLAPPAGPPSASAPPSPAPAAAKPVDLVIKSREQILGELRAARVSEADIAELMADLDRAAGKPAPAPATPTVSAPDTTDAPPGLEALLRAMVTNTAPDGSAPGSAPAPATGPSGPAGATGTPRPRPR